MAKTYTDELQHLAQCVPKLQKASGNPNKSYREIVVKFEGANMKNYANLAKALELYCWPTNTKQIRSVTDPFADGGPEEGKIEGLWRFVSVDPTHSRGEGVFLTLREGYASAIQWDEARVPSRDILPATDNVPIETGVTNIDEDYIDVLFPNVDPEKSSAIAEALLALRTVTGQTIWTHSFTGEYHVIRARVREEEDGSHSIFGLLAKPRSFVKTYDNYNSHNAADVYYLHHVPKPIVQSLVDDGVYKTDGASATLNYSTERGTYDVIIRTGVDEPLTVLSKQTVDGCQQEVYTSFYWGVTTDTMRSLSAAGAPAGWIYELAPPTPAANGRWNLRFTKIKAIAKTAPAYTSAITSSRETETQEKKNQTTIESIGEEEQGIIKRVRGLINRFCRFDTVKEDVTSTPWETTFTLTDGPDGEEVHTVKGNQRTIEFDAAGSGFANRLTGWSRNEDGTYNWHIVKEIDTFYLEVTNHWYYDIWHRRTRIVSSGFQTGWYQDEYRIYRYKYQTRRFTSEDEAYLWLRESTNFQPNSGVSTVGKNKFIAQRRFLERDFGWANDGLAYQ